MNYADDASDFLPADFAYADSFPRDSRGTDAERIESYFSLTGWRDAREIATRCLQKGMNPDLLRDTMTAAAARCQ